MTDNQASEIMTAGDYGRVVVGDHGVAAAGHGGQASAAELSRYLHHVTLQSLVDEATGLQLNPDGTVTVYHHTGADKAEAIRKTGQLKSAAEPHVYVTTRRETDTGYGDTAVAVRVDPALLQIDDEFPDGRVDYRIDVGRPGGSVKVRVLSSTDDTRCTVAAPIAATETRSRRQK